MKNKILFSIIFYCLISSCVYANVEKEIDSLSLFIDADFSSNLESSLAIERGVLTALSEVNNEINGKKITVERMDHRGNVARSRRNMQSYLDSPSALAIFSGLHSPPLLVHRDYININEILYLDPWAAAGPITRYPSDKNWIFRLSIDDTKAGEVIVSFAVDYKNTRKPCLLLENTGWGKSNIKTITQALKRRALPPPVILRFDWGLKIGAASALINTCVKNGADSIYLVANFREGASLVKAIAKSEIARKLPVFSHWGISGGSFHTLVPPMERDKIQLYLLQTRFSFLNKNLNNKQESVLEKAISLFDDYKKDDDIESMVGFIHAYDLTLLLIHSLKKSDMKGDIRSLRRTVRSNLERLDDPIEGLIKIYKLPFSQYSESNDDAHEALGEDDISMGQFFGENIIILDQWQYKPAKQ